MGDKMKRKFLTNKKGQGLMEYVIISALIGIVCIGAVKEFGNAIHTRINNIKKELVRNIN